MKMLSEDAVEVLESRRPIIAGAARLVVGDEPEDRYCLWSGLGDLPLDGDVFKGIADRSLITPVSSQIGGSSDSLTISLSQLDPDVAAAVEDGRYHQKPITVWRLVFAPDTFTLLDAMVFMRGRVDYITQREVVGGTATLDIAVEGPRRDMNRSGARLRSPAGKHPNAQPLLPL